jgi:drug/metabolite transporter (DMT)-like permease
MTVSLALVASLLWGTADFYCAMFSRRIHAVTVVFLSAATGLTGLLGIMAICGGWHTPGAYLWWGALAGVAYSVATIAFFRALADGTMSVIAPIGATGVIIPVAVSVTAGAVPSLLQLAGIAAAVVGIALASEPELHRGRHQPAGPPFPGRTPQPHSDRGRSRGDLRGCAHHQQLTAARPGRGTHRESRSRS